MQYVSCDISTICVGMAASMAATLLAAGAKGKRIALPNSEVLLHQVMGGAEGQAADVEISAKHLLAMKDRLNRILAKHTGQPISKIAKDTDRDFYLDAEGAKTYGVVDKLVASKKAA